MAPAFRADALAKEKKSCQAKGMNKLLLWSLLLLICGPSFAQDDMTSSFEYTERVRQRLVQLRELEASQYLSTIDSFRQEMERYFDHKKRVCEGDFSALILSESRSEERSRPMSKEERQLCYNELKALHTTYINGLFQARERFLIDLHDRRLKDLQASREEALKNLESSFGQKRR